MHQHVTPLAAVCLVALTVVEVSMDTGGVLPLGGGDAVQAGIVFGSGFIIAETILFFQRAFGAIKTAIRRMQRDHAKRLADGRDRTSRALSPLSRPPAGEADI